MKTDYFTVGPSQLYPTIRGHIEKALKDGTCSISHRGSEFKQIYYNTQKALRDLLNIPDNFQIFFVGSATEAMERILQYYALGCTFHFVDGAFSKRFYEMSKNLGFSPIAKYADVSHNFMGEEIPNSCNLICITQNETSLGTIFPIDDIWRLRNLYPDRIIAIDVVSAVPYLDIPYSSIDCAFFSVQKGFGLPAGLGVILANNKRIVKYNKNFHNFDQLRTKALEYQTVETPNVLGIYLLGKVCEDMFKKGIDKIRHTTAARAKILYDIIGDRVDSFAPYRSNTIIVANCDGNKIADMLANNNIIVSKGYGEKKDKQIRIANFPAHSGRAFKKLVKLLK